MHLFYDGGSGKSGKKGRYAGVALEYLLGSWNKSVEAAIAYFEKMKGFGNSDVVSHGTKMKALETLVKELRVVATVVPAANALAQSLEDAIALTDKVAVLTNAACEKLSKEIDEARKKKAITAPVLGCATRWIIDKKASVEFIVEQYGVIVAFVESEMKRMSKKASTRPASLVKLDTLLAANEATRKDSGSNPIVDEGKLFLTELKPLFDLLERFSDQGRPMAACVMTKIHELETSAAGNEKLKQAFDYHMARIRRHHDGIKAFYLAAWFHPDMVLSRAQHEQNPPSAEAFASLLGMPLDEAEWKSYTSSQRFTQWKAGDRDEVAWWKLHGSTAFPKLGKVAISFLSLPAVVTKCDSLMSVMGAKFSKRQASMSNFNMSNQVFARANTRRTATYARIVQIEESDLQESPSEYDDDDELDWQALEEGEEGITFIE